MNVILYSILVLICYLFLIAQSGYCQNTDSENSDSILSKSDLSDSINIDVKILTDSLLDQLCTTVKKAESNIINTITEQGSSIITDQTSPIASVTEQWDAFKVRAELWKKCGMIGDGLLPALPVNVSSYSLSSSGTASIQSQYNNSGSDLARSFAPEGWYSILSASNSLKIASVPVTLSGNIVFQNNTINLSYSTGNFSFDYNKLLETFKQRLVSTKTLEALKDVDVVPDMVLDSIAMFEELKAWVTDPVVNEEYIKSLHLLDSIETLAKSTALYFADSMLLDSMTEVKSKYEQARKFYDKLFKLYQKYEEQIVELEHKLKEVKKIKMELESITNPDVLLAALNQDSLLSKKEQMLSSVRQFQLGSGAVTISPLTLQDFLFKGMQTEIYSKGMYLSAGGGVMQSFPFLVPGAWLPENFLKRTVGYVTLGEGTTDSSYTHGSLVYLHDNPTTAGNAVGYVVSKTDWIGSVRKKMLLGEKYSVYTEWAYSSLNFKGPTSSEPSLTTPAQGKADVLAKSAAEVSFRRDDENDHATILFRIIGPGYVTLGNPMSLSNMMHTEIEYGTSVFDNKLEATIAGYYDQPLIAEITGYNAQRWGVRTKALYHLPQNLGFVSISWMPDQLQTTSMQQSNVSSVYQHLSVNGFLNYQFLKTRQSTFADVSAFFGSAQFGENASVSKVITGSLMQEIFIGKQHLSLQCFGTQNKNASFVSSQLIFQATDCIALNKNSIVVGSNWTAMSSSPALAGIILGGNIIVKKAGMVSVTANLKAAIGGKLNFNNSQQMISMMWQVNW